MLLLLLLAAAAVITPSLGFVVPPAAAPASAARWQPVCRGSSTAAAGQPRAQGTKAYAIGAKGLHGGAGGSRSRTVAPPTMMATPLPETPDAPPTTEELRPALVYGESAARSFVKALVWRLTAGVVTLVSGLVFSGSLATAMSIVGSDFVTKSGFMFAGERLWNKVKWGQDKSGDSTKRSLAKAVLWRVFAASNTLICGVFLAKDLSVASKIAGTDTLFKTALFFLNERAWTKIDWGKEYEPEYYL
ncbi:unnamed protein product [Ectocarpus sp. CCAP 1310/34]|nr:unnamed protein product [Ectocarpus sp. CCAP 1310/34]